MSRMLKPVFAGLAISSLCLALAADLRAQGGGNTRSPGAADSRAKGAPKTSSAMKSQIKKVQAEDDDEPLPPRRGSANDDPADDADEPAPPPRGGTKPARPGPMPVVRIPKLSPELEKVLKDWELRTSQINTMSGTFTKFIYSHTFETETRAEGNFDFASPDKGNYEIRGTK